MNNKVLILRTCNADMTSSHGFTWPKDGPVEATDWDTKPECGGGLHGLMWGQGDWRLLRGELTAIWQVVEVDEADIVKIDSAKVKFKKGNVIFTGEMGKAVTMVLCHKENFAKTFAEAKEKSEGDYSKAASSGTSSTAASSGNSSAAASSGDYSKAASSGYCGIAMVAGTNGQAKAGIDGCFALAYLDKNGRPRILAGHVGEDGIKADTWYRISDGKLEEVPR
jgi:hypothetical protein